MHTWKLKNAQHRLRELVRLALTKEPQRLSNGKDAVVVIAASEYARLVAAAPKPTGPELARPMRTRPKPDEAAPPVGREHRSAWAWIEEFRSKHDMEEVGWPYEWDCDTRSWILPEEHAVSP